MNLQRTFWIVVGLSYLASPGCGGGGGESYDGALAALQSAMGSPMQQWAADVGKEYGGRLRVGVGKTDLTEAKQAVEGRAGRYGNEICAEIKKHKAVAQRSKVEGTEDAISSAIDLPTVDAFGSDLVQLNDLKVVLPLFMLVAPERIRRL